MAKSIFEERTNLENFILKGKYSQASKLIDELETLEETPHIEILQIRYFKALIRLEEGNINLALDIGKSNYPDVLQVVDTNLAVLYNYLIAQCLLLLGRLDEGKKYLDEFSAIIENNTIEDKYDMNTYCIFLNSLKGSHARHSGKYEEAIMYYTRIIDLCQKEHTILELYKAYNIIGSLYYEKGEYKLALENYKLALDKARKGENLKFIAYSLNDISNLYIKIGEIDLAELYLQERIKMENSQIKDKIDIGFTSYLLGEIEISKGNYELAFQHFINGYTEIEIIGASRLESIGLGHLILTCLNLGELDQAQYYLNIEQELVERTDNLNITGSYNYNRALVLRSKNRLTHIVKAQEILEDQLSNDNLSAKIKLISTILLAEILIEEVKITNSNREFETLKDMINNLHQAGVATNAYNIIINTLILKYKFALIDGDFTKAMKNLDEAAFYSKIKGLSGLAKKVEYEHKDFDEKLKKWKSVELQSTDLYHKILLSSVQQYLQEVQKIRFKLKG